MGRRGRLAGATVTASEISAIGAVAHAALVRGHGVARVFARLARSTYLTAADSLVWLGPAGAMLHPRAILVASAPPHEADELQLEVDGLAPWHPRRLALDREAVATLIAGWRTLVSDLARLGTPAGFGALLAGERLAFPLDAGRTAALALAAACARDDGRAAVEAALALLGLGAGLTPSGDDYVGAAFFARGLLVEAGLADAAAWRAATAEVLAAAPARTTPISVALLGDLARGQTWAALHDVVGALAVGALAAARDASRSLVGLGHSSGWDMLAGLDAGLQT